MDRIARIVDADDLDAKGRDVAARVVETRGSITPPFQVLLHAPEFADEVARLGQLVRTGVHLGDADRELATLAAGRALGCGFVWSSHLASARRAGLDEETIAAVDGGDVPSNARGGTVVAFVRELCDTGRVTDETFRSAHDLLGTHGVVELSTTVGYYAMLALVMGAADVC